MSRNTTSKKGTGRTLAESVTSTDDNIYAYLKNEVEQVVNRILVEEFIPLVVRLHQDESVSFTAQNLLRQMKLREPVGGVSTGKAVGKAAIPTPEEIENMKRMLSIRFDDNWKLGRCPVFSGYVKTDKCFRACGEKIEKGEDEDGNPKEYYVCAAHRGKTFEKAVIKIYSENPNMTELHYRMLQSQKRVVALSKKLKLKAEDVPPLRKVVPAPGLTMEPFKPAPNQRETANLRAYKNSKLCVVISPFQHKGTVVVMSDKPDKDIDNYGLVAAIGLIEENATHMKDFKPARAAKALRNIIDASNATVGLKAEFEQLLKKLDPNGEKKCRRPKNYNFNFHNSGDEDSDDDDGEFVSSSEEEEEKPVRRNTTTQNTNNKRRIADSEEEKQPRNAGQRFNANTSSSHSEENEVVTRKGQNNRQTQQAARSRRNRVNMDDDDSGEGTDWASRNKRKNNDSVSDEVDIDDITTSA